MTDTQRETTAGSKLNPIEQEVVFLKAALDVIDSMANHAMLKVHGSFGDNMVMFESTAHQKLFNILLVDFLSRTDKRAPPEQNSFLGALRTVAKTPHFNAEGTVTQFKDATSTLVDWLNEAPLIRVWLPTIDTDTSLRLSRLTYLKMSGDISKHNILRASGVAEDLRAALKGAKVIVDLDDALLALNDFYERFHTDILDYHASYIVEMLNNISWGIHNYLGPGFRRTYEPVAGSPPMYRFNYPAGVEGKFARSQYWDLMNDVRRGPILKPFKVTRHLKGEY